MKSFVIPALLSFPALLFMQGCLLMPTESRDIVRDIYEIRVQTARLQTMQAETRKLLESRLEEDRSLRKAQYEALLANQKDMERRLQDMKKQIRNLQEQTDGSDSLADSSNRPGALAVDAAGGVIDPAPLLKDSRVAFSRGDYSGARQASLQFLRHFAVSPQAAEARFILADTWYYEGDMEKALDNFLKIPDDFPASPRVPDALVKASYCQVKLGRNQDARDLLQRVITEYPEYSGIHRARKTLEDLKD